jgi:hypothetical protein
MRNWEALHGKQLYEDGLYGLFPDSPLRHKEVIKSIDLKSSKDNQCRVYFYRGSVYSQQRFLPGDIIEICPCREISKNSLYSREVRDLAFEVDEDYYVIPFGYCEHYDVVDSYNSEPNCDYEWNPDDKTIIIRAICRIPKDTLLVLNINK